MGDSPISNSGRTGSRRRVWIVLPLAFAGALAMLLGWQQVSARRSAAEQTRLVSLGRRTYARECAACHGTRMEGRTLGAGVAVPPLDKPGFRVFFWLLPAAMEDWVRGQIDAGNAVMPQFGVRLDTDALDALAVYLRLVNTGVADPG